MYDLDMAPILILLLTLLYSPADCNPVRSGGQGEDGDGWPDGWVMRCALPAGYIPVCRWPPGSDLNQLLDPHRADGDKLVLCLVPQGSNAGMDIRQD